MRSRLFALLAIAVAGLVLLGNPGIAAAAPSAVDTTQEEINAILAEYPDAVQTGKDSVTFSNGVMRMVGATETDCPADALCLWDDQFYTGQLEIIYSYVCDFALTVNLKDTGFNDRASSWKDNTTRRVGIVYWHYDAINGVLWRMFPQQKAPTLPAEFNDEASAVTCYNLF